MARGGASPAPPNRIRTRANGPPHRRRRRGAVPRARPRQIGRRAANRFRAALAGPPSLLVDRVLRPHLFRCEPGRDIWEGTYQPVALTAKTPGRNHELAQALARGAPGGCSASDPEAWAALTFFANALRPCLPDWDETVGREVWQSPSERVAVGPHHVFTYEHDLADLGFLREQLSWLASRKKPGDSPMGRLFARLSEHADFAGLTVNYSGHKSLHIHAVFDTRLAREGLDLDGVADPRPGFVAHWDLLKPVVRDALGVPAGVEPDPMLRFPESYRRTPNAYRPVEGDGHILGVPPGTWVRQVALWERWRDRAAPKASALFFQPGPFHAPAQGILRETKAAGRRRASSGRRQSDAGAGGFLRGQATGALRRLAETRRPQTRARQVGGEVLQLASRPQPVVHPPGGLRDRPPSGYRRPPPPPATAPVPAVAHDSVLGRSPRAAAPEPRRSSGGGDRRPPAAEPRSATIPWRSPSARRRAILRPRAPPARRFFLEAVASHRLLWVRGPEGVGKSSALFAEHHRITRAHRGAGRSALGALRLRRLRDGLGEVRGLQQGAAWQRLRRRGAALVQRGVHARVPQPGLGADVAGRRRPAGPQQPVGGRQGAPAAGLGGVPGRARRGVGQGRWRADGGFHRALGPARLGPAEPDAGDVGSLVLAGGAG